MTTPDFRTEAQGHLGDLISLRRKLHANPELGFDLPFTQATVLDELAGLGLEITTGESLTSVVAVLKGGKPGPAVLLRGDMDALPVVEDTGLDFASENGNMHACGHDLHTAGLVGAARLLAAHREEIPGSIIFMFQPAEEVEGGAEPMIAEGVLEAAGVPAIAAYGIHVEADVRGRFTTKGGPLMAGFADLNLTIHGAGGHSSQPQATRDPVPALAEVVLALNTMTGRSFDIFDPVVVSVTQLEAAQASNVIPDSAKLTASIRFLSAESVALLQERVTEIAENIARAHRCTAEVDFRGDSRDREQPCRVDGRARATGLGIRVRAGRRDGASADGVRGLLIRLAESAGHIRVPRCDAGGHRPGRRDEPFAQGGLRRRAPWRSSRGARPLGIRAAGGRGAGLRASCGCRK